MAVTPCDHLALSYTPRLAEKKHTTRVTRFRHRGKDRRFARTHYLAKHTSLGDALASAYRTNTLKAELKPEAATVVLPPSPSNCMPGVFISCKIARPGRSASHPGGPPPPAGRRLFAPVTRRQDARVDLQRGADGRACVPPRRKRFRIPARGVAPA